MYSILVADDEEMIRRLIRKYAEFEGHTVTEASDGMEAVSLCRSHVFDIVIMDIMMPELDGFSASREIRKFSSVPIIMLSARGEEYDKINGFEIGVDDYVVKPFSPRELMLRIHAILSRSARQKDTLDNGVSEPAFRPANERFTYKGLIADFTARLVYVDGQKVDMTPKEYDLFFYMVRNRNIALTREKLITEVWGYDFYGDDRTLDTHIKLLRHSLGPYASMIVTLRGVGYRFDTTH